MTPPSVLRSSRITAKSMRDLRKHRMLGVWRRRREKSMIRAKQGVRCKRRQTRPVWNLHPSAARRTLGTGPGETVPILAYHQPNVVEE
jgi:hypothetical protein